MNKSVITYTQGKVESVKFVNECSKYQSVSKEGIETHVTVFTFAQSS